MVSRGQWLTRVVRRDFVTLVVGSQEPSGEWVEGNVCDL